MYYFDYDMHYFRNIAASLLIYITRRVIHGYFLRIDMAVIWRCRRCHFQNGIIIWSITDIKMIFSWFRGIAYSLRSEWPYNEPSFKSRWWGTMKSWSLMRGELCSLAAFSRHEVAESIKCISCLFNRLAVRRRGDAMNIRRHTSYIYHSPKGNAGQIWPV